MFHRIHFKEDAGFTLIELIVVIVIIGVLAVVLISSINPLDKIYAAKDATVISDVRLFGQAMDSYAARHEGHYIGAATFDDAIVTLYNAGELKSSFYAPPSGYSGIAFGYQATPVTCSTDGPNYCMHYYFSGGLKSQQNINAHGDMFIWTDSGGCYWNSTFPIFQSGYTPCSL